jgi:oxygen-independent coproporphyrinogen-3 oxidase
MKRYANVESAADYVQRWRDGRPVQAGVTDATLDEERFFLGLRLMRGVEPSTEEWRQFEAPIQRSIEAGLLEREGATVRLTQRGVLLSNEVFQEFITA